MSTCRVTPGCTNPVENQDTGACASCGAALRKAERQSSKDSQRKEVLLKRPPKLKQPIKTFSEKRKAELIIYAIQKHRWINGKRCVVYPDMPATTVHHMKGRQGFADDWARENNIPLLLDERFWLPTSLHGHRYIEDHRAWAEEKGFTLSRSEKI